jgi:hypothetical protein
VPATVIVLTPATEPHAAVADVPALENESPESDAILHVGVVIPDTLYTCPDVFKHPSRGDTGEINGPFMFIITPLDPKHPFKYP